MGFVSINHHDWFDAAEILFAADARAKGIKPGTPAWYAHSIDLPVPDPVHFTDGLAQNLAESLDKIITENSEYGKTT